MEVFDSFGIADEVSKLWAPINSWAVWSEDDQGNISRQFRTTNSPPVRTKYDLPSIFIGIWRLN